MKFQTKAWLCYKLLAINVTVQDGSAELTALCTID